MERVVNIIGMGASSVDVPDVGENWILNLAYKKLKNKKIDKMFFMDDFGDIISKDTAIHPVDYTLDLVLKNNPKIEFISRYNSQIKDKDGLDVHKIIEYPLDKAIELAGGGYFTSTIAYTICYAILEKVDRIRLFGFEIWSGSDSNEYDYQRPCVDFWLTFAIARGIKVEVPYMTMQNVTNKQNYYGFKKDELMQNYRR